MLLSELLHRDLEQDVPVLGLAMHTDHLQPGFVFCALGQDSALQYRLIRQAEKNGASAVLLEHAGNIDSNLPLILVSDLQERIPELIEHIYPWPKSTMRLLAVTGTNGKTSVAWMAAQMLTQAGIPAGYSGTIGWGAASQPMNPSRLTTPDRIETARRIYELSQQGVQSIVLEASSHGLDQGRLLHLPVYAGAFLNIGHDHLDYHSTAENYLACKRKIFSDFPDAACIINLDDAAGRILAAEMQSAGRAVLTFASQNAADLNGTVLQAAAEGLFIRLSYKHQTVEVQLPLFGLFQLENILAVVGFGLALDLSFDQIVAVLGSVQAPAGRMQNVSNEKGLVLFIDYAHTPDALQKSLLSARAHTSSNAQLWVVFGCGGDRDQTKRPEMGKVAAQYADRTVLTADNPRSEDPLNIVSEIEQGIPSESNYSVILDRKEAVFHAVQNAKPGDSVLIAGKGHETWQEVSGKKIPMSDLSFVQEALLVAA